MDFVKAVLTPLAYLVLAVAPAVAAAELADPTRPPAAIGSTSRAADVGGPVLQSVLIAPGRREAMINGQTVKVGHTIGDARVEKIAESEVVLRNGKDLQVLKLFPSIEKKPVTRTSSPNRPAESER